MISSLDLQISLISGGHDLRDHLRSKRGLRLESEHRKTYDLIPRMTIFIDFIFWPPEVINIWRSPPPGSSEVKKGSQNGIGTPKKLSFDTSHDLFSLISYFDLQRSFISGGHDLQYHLELKKVSEWNQNTKKPMIWYLTWPIYIDLIFWPF